MIWGVDPASKSIAMFTSDGLLLQAHKLTVPRSNRGRELGSLRAEMEHWLKLDPNPIVFVEEPVLAGKRNIRSTILVAETAGMIMSYNCPTYLVPVTSWKKATTGNGWASKDDVAVWLKQAHPEYSQLCGDDQDLIDAACISCYGSGLSAKAVDLSRRGDSDA